MGQRRRRVPRRCADRHDRPRGHVLAAHHHTDGRQARAQARPPPQPVADAVRRHDVLLDDDEPLPLGQPDTEHVEDPAPTPNDHDPRTAGDPARGHHQPDDSSPDRAAGDEQPGPERRTGEPRHLLTRRRQEGTACPFPITTTPPSLRWKPRARSSSGSYPIDTPAGTTTPLSMITRRRRAPLPTLTPCIRTQPSTSAPECAWTSGESTDWRTFAPDTMRRGETSDSMA